MKKLQNKVAIVTGASKGIGASIAKHLAAEGAAVVANYASSKEGADRVVAEIRRIQDAYGRDAFAVYSGSSLTTEKAYLMGKFARVAVGTRHVDYNGRLCMVSAATANRLAFGVDRASSPWFDLLDTEVVLVAGTNIGECFPVLTQYVWGARDRGAHLVTVTVSDGSLQAQVERILHVGDTAEPADISVRERRVVD